MQKGCLAEPSFCHSKKPVAGTRQRRCLNAERNDGFSATVSLRALMMGFGLRAQAGRSPHRTT
jgi:hypothetical protein